MPPRLRLGLLPTLLLALLFLPTVAAALAAGGPPAPPEQPATGPGGRTAPFSSVVAERHGALPLGYWLFTPADPVGEAGDVPGPLRLVVFLHGFTAVDPTVYQAWIDHLVKRGAVVVYPDYQTAEPFGTAGDAMLPNAVGAVADAVTSLRAAGGVRVDLTRMALVGHSLGGVLTMAVAAVAVDAGLPEPVALMPIQPGGCRGCSPLLTRTGIPLPDLAPIPETSRLLMLVGEEDEVAGDDAARVLWMAAPSIPPERRHYIVLRSDEHGAPALRANHQQPLTGGRNGAVDALDWYGTWKLFDLLMECAFADGDCDGALGKGHLHRDMGRWSDGVAVTEPVVAPVPPLPES